MKAWQNNLLVVFLIVLGLACKIGCDAMMDHVDLPAVPRWLAVPLVILLAGLLIAGMIFDPRQKRLSRRGFQVLPPTKTPDGPMPATKSPTESDER